jgi:hypothetical protein
MAGFALSLPLEPRNLLAKTSLAAAATTIPRQTIPDPKYGG